MATPSPAGNSGSGRGPTTFDDLTAGLIWPKALREFPMALQPGHVLLGTIAVVLFMAVGSLFDAVAGPMVATSVSGGGGMNRLGQSQGLFQYLVHSFLQHMHGAILSLFKLDFHGAWDSLSRLFGKAIPGLASGHPGAFAAFVLVMLGLFMPARMVIGGAIARSVACEMGLRRDLSVRAALLFAAPRWRSLLGGVLFPMLLIGLLCALLVVGGLVFFRVPGLNIAGAFLYGLFLLGGALVVFIGVAFVFAIHMTFPAVAADGADAVDAIQRAYAYTITRPGRTILYAALLVAIGVVAYSILSMLVAFALNVTAGLAGVWSHADLMAGGFRAFDFSTPPPAPTLKGTFVFADRVIGVWERLVLALLAGFVVSYHDCASTILYLLLRRATDEQDIEEIWTPPEEQPASAAVAPGAVK